MTPLAIWLDRFPTLAVGSGLLLIFLIASEIGVAAHGRLGLKDDETGDQSHVLSTALLLGFTLSVAGARYDTRRAKVTEESNNIGKAWLRAGLVETPAGAAIEAKLANYALVTAILDGAPGQTIASIIDLNRPQNGSVLVSRQPITDLLAGMAPTMS